MADSLAADDAGAWLGDESAGTPDAVFESLRRALDVDSMRSRLQPLFEPDARLQQVEVHHVSFAPRRAARVAYRLRLADRKGNECAHFMAGLLRGKRQPTARQRAATRVSPHFGPAFHWLEDPVMTLFGFPNDPKLRGIMSLTPASVSLCSPLGTVGVSEVVRYVPGKRLLMRHVAAEGSFYTKTVSRDRGRTGLRVGEGLWRRAQADPAAFVVARPFGSLQESETIVLENLEAWRPLSLPPQAGWAQWGARVGEALARLHSTEQKCLDVWSRRDELAQLSGALQRLVRHQPSWLAQCRSVWQSAMRVQTPVSLDVPIHGAFRVTQMLTRDDRLALLDLEGFRRGDPHVDLATLVAHLDERVLDGELVRRDVEAAAEAVRGAYAAAVPWQLDPAHLAWQTAVRLVSGHAKNCLSRLDPRLDTKIPALLEKAVQGFQLLPKVSASRNTSQT